MTRTILCYGDSNTWGSNPADGSRFPRDIRWAGRLQQELGDGYRVIEEGLNGRTTIWDDPMGDHWNGREYLIPCLDSHRPLDLVILMLGTNDLKPRFALTAFDIAYSVGLLVDLCHKSIAGPRLGPPQVLVICPPPVIEVGQWRETFEGAEEKCKLLPERYRAVADQRGCPFLDAGSVIQPSPVDGIHFEAQAHLALSHAVAGKVREILP